MTLTTIKVSAELRDILKGQAAAAGRTLGAHLEQLAADEERRLRFEELRRAMELSPADRQYRDEASQWQSGPWT